MGSVSVLLCVCLAGGSFPAVHGALRLPVQPAPGSQKLLDELSKMRQSLSSFVNCKSDGGLGAVVAQQAGEVSSVKDKVHALETKLLAATAQSHTSTRQTQQHDTRLDVMEAELRETKRDLQSTKTDLLTTKTDLLTTKQLLITTKNELNTTQGDLQHSRMSFQTLLAELETKVRKEHAFKADQGSSFVRWGRTTCPDNTALVYEGVTGGKSHDQKGSGTNPLCLTLTPQFDHTANTTHHGQLSGAEYEHIPGHHHHDVPCSLCLAPHATTVMVPGARSCPTGWTPQYTGHLVAQQTDYAASEYVCLDSEPERGKGGEKEEKGLLLSRVVAVCGSLPCPPYIHHGVVTCVVCSK